MKNFCHIRYLVEYLNFGVTGNALFLYLVVSGLYFSAIMQQLVEWSPLIESWLLSASVWYETFIVAQWYSLFLCVLCFRGPTLFVKRCVCQLAAAHQHNKELFDWLIDWLNVSWRDYNLAEYILSEFMNYALFHFCLLPIHVLRKNSYSAYNVVEMWCFRDVWFRRFLERNAG